MKKFLKNSMIAAAGLLFALAVVFLPKTVSAAERIEVTQLEDITDVQTVTSVNYEVGKGAYSKLVQFTLEKPAYVYVSAYSTVSYQGWDVLGIITDFAVYSDANCSNLVKNDKNQGLNLNTKASKYLCLDAGDYWIYFSKSAEVDEYVEESSGEFRLSVAAQYLDVAATKNGSWARAASISTDQKVTGFLSNSTRTSWYKFSVADGTMAKISVSLDNPMGKMYFNLSPTGVTLYRSTHKYITSFNVTDNTYYQTAASSDVTLSAGTYYLAVTGDESYSRWETTKLEPNEYSNMGGVNLKITTIKKTSISKLTNAKGKKIQVNYKAVSGAEGYEVSYSTDKNFKKGVKAVSVGKATKATITGLTKKKTYYVRVRAIKTDEDGNTLTGAWSAAKNIKVTK